MENRTIERAVAQSGNENKLDFVALWTAGLWLAALIYLLATFDSMH
jgi:hypothetical protein